VKSTTSASQGALERALAALHGDLLDHNGPRISTMRNYRFAIVPYRPEDEFKLRRQMTTLTTELRREGWSVLSISLQKLLLDRIRASGDASVDAIIAREKRLYERSPERAFESLREKIVPMLEGADGLAGDVARLVGEFAAREPERSETALVVLGRAGALYPFFRMSALLKHIDGRTHNLPVVLLYPGTVTTEGNGPLGLSFMGELAADRDYRPRIYA
jgi:hypothetical protein